MMKLFSSMCILFLSFQLQASDVVWDGNFGEGDTFSPRDFYRSSEINDAEKWSLATGQLYVYKGKKFDKEKCIEKTREREDFIEGNYFIIGLDHSAHRSGPRISSAFDHDNSLMANEIEKVVFRIYREGKRKKYKKVYSFSLAKEKYAKRWEKGQFHKTFHFKRPKEDKHKLWKVLFEIHLKDGTFQYRVLQLQIMNDKTKYRLVKGNKAIFEVGGQNIISDLIVNRSLTHSMHVRKNFEFFDSELGEFAKGWGVGAAVPVDDGNMPQFKNMQEYSHEKNERYEIQVTEHLNPGRAGYWVQSEILKKIPVDIYKFTGCGLPKYSETDYSLKILKAYHLLSLEESQLGQDVFLKAKLEEHKRNQERAVELLNYKNRKVSNQGRWE